MEVSADEGEGLVVDALEAAEGGVEHGLKFPCQDGFEQACDSGLVALGRRSDAGEHFPGQGGVIQASREASSEANVKRVISRVPWR